MFSPRSLITVALSLAMVLIGINSQSGWLFWLAGLLLAALAVSWLDSLFQVRNLEAERIHKPAVSEDQALDIRLKVRNRGRFPRHLLAVVDGDPCRKDAPARFTLKAPRRSFKSLLREADTDEPYGQDAGPHGIIYHANEPAPLFVSRLAGGGETALSYRRAGLRRGVYRDWPVYFYSEGILGFSRHSSRVNPASRLEVLPSYVELASFPLLDSLLQRVRQPQHAAVRGEGLDFYGVREYQPGDPLGRVHWRTTARRGALVVREFERERGMRLVILIDNRSRDLRGWKPEDRLDLQARIAASAAEYAWTAGCPVTLAAYQGMELMLYDTPGFQAALSWLASLEATGEPEPEEQLKGLAPLLGGETFICQIMAVEDQGELPPATAVPPTYRLAWILVVGPGGGKPWGGPFAKEALRSRREESLSEPPPQLAGLILCREGEDLRKCLENPLTGSVDWRDPGR